MIQCYELHEYYYVSIHCLFCGAKVMDWDTQEEEGRSQDVFNPCKHTLFICDDIEFYYSSSRFDSVFDIKRAELAEESIDVLTNQVRGIEDAIKISAYTGMPSGAGVYVAFAPMDD